MDEKASTFGVPSTGTIGPVILEAGVIWNRRRSIESLAAFGTLAEVSGFGY